MLRIQTPKSEANLVCPVVDEMTREISFESRLVDWVLVFSSCSVGYFFERVVVLCTKLQSFPLCWENFKELFVAE